MGVVIEGVSSVYLSFLRSVQAQNCNGSVSGTNNGNPPAIAATADGRLCAVFGERDEGRILAAYSSDLGETWTVPIVLRDDFGSEDNETNDLGYPRLLRRSDGKMVAVYYYSTNNCLHHIAATIWMP